MRIYRNGKVITATTGLHPDTLSLLTEDTRLVDLVNTQDDVEIDRKICKILGTPLADKCREFATAYEEKKGEWESWSLCEEDGSFKI